MKNTQSKKQEEKACYMSLRHFWDSIKHSKTHITGAPEGRERKAEKTLDKIKAENFPNLKKETNIQAQESESLKQDQLRQTHIKTYHHSKSKI